MRSDKLASYFSGVEFIAAIDWTPTETTMFANIGLPGSTYLENPGTRLNFEGNLTTFNPVLKPPSGVEGWKVLAGVANAFGIDIPTAGVEKLTAKIEALVKESTGRFMPYYWNAGQPREWDGNGCLIVADVTRAASHIPPPLSEIEHYKYEIHEVGIDHFRVRSHTRV